MQKWIASFVGITQLAIAEEKGHAKIELLLASKSYQAGEAIQAALRMTYDSGWHGYWINPGEGGMKTTVKWSLPPGWTAGPLEFPVPKHEIIDGLAYYGYTGTVVIPLLFYPPAKTSGKIAIHGELRWLACSGQQCAAGDATLNTVLSDGPIVNSADAEVIRMARTKLPKEDKQLALSVKAEGDQFRLIVHSSAKTDLEGAEIFPITEQALDPTGRLFLKKNGNGYEVTVSKNEYAQNDLSELDLVIVCRDTTAVILRWRKKT